MSRDDLKCYGFRKYGRTILKSKPKKIASAVLIGLLIFALGTFSTTYTNSVGVPWLKALANKIPKELARDANLDFSYPRVIGTSLFTFKTTDVFSKRGVFQIALDDDGKLFAIDRDYGHLYLWNPSDNSIEKLPNVFKTLGLSSNNLNLVMDIHFAFSKLFVSIVVPSEDQKCEQLIAFELTRESNLILKSKEFFRSPCTEDRLNPRMWAGRFTNSKKSLFLSVGDQRYDRSGFPKQGRVIQNEIKNSGSVFGKILIFPATLESFEVFSSGHRNAQGLFYSSATSKLYESEHGTVGGDEINVLKKGYDYGWPKVGYGSSYGWIFSSGEKNPDKVRGSNFNSTLNKTFGFIRGTHPGYEKPMFSWYPSVAVGALKEVSGVSKLTEWRTNILVATFADNGIHRLEVSDGKIVLDEKIDVGGRVRDFEITELGELFVAYDKNNLILLKPSKNL